MKQLLHNESSIWRHRDLRIAAGARAVSFLGDEVALIALLLRIHDTGGGPRGVAALLLAAAIPTVVLAPWAGRVADRYDSRRVLVTCGLVQATLCLALAFTTPILGVLALVACLQAVQAVVGPAWAALVPEIVGEGETGRAVGAMQSLTLLAGVAGPAVAGLLVAASGTVWPLLLDAATFLVLAGAGYRVRTRRGGRTEDSGPEPRLLDGVRIIRADALLAPLTAGLLAFVVVGEVTNVVEVFLVRDSLEAGPQAFGILGALFAIGAATGALLGGRAKDDRARTRLVVLTAGVLAICTCAAGLVPTVVAFGLVWVVAGIANGALNVSVSTLLVLRAPAANRGQVIAALGGLARGASLLATLLGGWIGLVLAPGTIFVLAGVGAGIVTVGLAVAVLRVRSAPVVACPEAVSDLGEPVAVER